MKVEDSNDCSPRADEINTEETVTTFYVVPDSVANTGNQRVHPGI